MEHGDVSPTPQSSGGRRLGKDEISRSNLARLVDLWERLRKGDDLPARREVRPEDLSFVIAQVMLIDVHRRLPGPVAPAGGESDLRFRFRLVGTRIEETGHGGLQGRWVHELQPTPYRRLVLQAYREAVQEAAPNFYRVALEHGGQQLRYERVTLPLADDGRTVDTLLVGTEWEPANVAFFRAFPALGAAASDGPPRPSRKGWPSLPIS